MRVSLCERVMCRRAFVECFHDKWRTTNGHNYVHVKSNLIFLFPSNPGNFCCSIIAFPFFYISVNERNRMLVRKNKRRLCLYYIPLTTLNIHYRYVPLDVWRGHLYWSAMDRLITVIHMLSSILHACYQHVFYCLVQNKRLYERKQVQLFL